MLCVEIFADAATAPALNGHVSLHFKVQIVLGASA